LPMSMYCDHHGWSLSFEQKTGGLPMEIQENDTK
jgi:hypothetical protein